MFLIMHDCTPARAATASPQAVTAGSLRHGVPWWRGFTMNMSRNWFPVPKSLEIVCSRSARNSKVRVVGRGNSAEIILLGCYHSFFPPQHYGSRMMVRVHGFHATTKARRQHRVRLDLDYIRVDA